MSNEDILTREEKPLCSHVLNTIPVFSIEQKECPYKNTCTEIKTLEKIAEKLAEQVKRDVVFYDSEGINFCEISNAEFGKCFKHNNGASCKQCIIDWARKEVEK